jgi:inosine-uridine nucleoside N-ribohydrolase/plastocyanin
MIGLSFRLALGVSLLVSAGAVADVSAAAAVVPSAVNVSVSASSCRIIPGRVPAGAVRFTISNRSVIAQRFAIAEKMSAPVRPGGRVTYQAILNDPGSYTYKCVPSRGSAHRGRLQVAHNVVVETDMDASDAMAILYLLRRADVEVGAIVVDGDGEARCPAGATNALSLVALAGKPNIPVGCGRPLPLKGAHAFPTAWRDFVDNLFGQPRPATPARQPAGSGEEVFRTAIRSAPGQVEVLTLGPPTELAAVLSANASVKDKIRSVTMMGGAVSVPGNITWPPDVGNSYTEWNFYIDPTAANTVLSSGLEITLVPLDATKSVPLNAAVAGRLGGSPTATFIRRLIESLLPSSTLYFWDPLSAAVLVEPAIASYADKRLAVVEGEGPESGRTIQAADGGQIHVTVSADRGQFESSFVSTLR